MISSLGRFETVNGSLLEDVEQEMNYLRDTLEVLMVTKEISNDAFLEAGSIQGGLSVIINLVSNGISDEEANAQLQNLKSRANSLNEKYPGLDEKIESRRI